MNTMRPSLHSKVHNWIDKMGFKLNFSATDPENKFTTNHWFFETFNFIERTKTDDPKKAKFVCFDAYGEKLNVRSLLDIQSAFYENISQLK